MVCLVSNNYKKLKDFGGGEDFRDFLGYSFILYLGKIEVQRSCYLGFMLFRIIELV